MAEKFDGLIDEPSPYATLATWERHLEALKNLDAADSFETIKTEMVRNALQARCNVKRRRR